MTEATVPETTEEWTREKQGKKLQARRQGLMDELYKGQKYTIAKEIALPAGQKFRTPLGHLGSKGYALVNLDPTAEGDKAKHIVGATLLRKIAELYEAVELPEVKPPGRPDKGGKVKTETVAAAQTATADILAQVAAAVGGSTSGDMADLLK